VLDGLAHGSGDATMEQHAAASRRDGDEDNNWAWTYSGHWRQGVREGVGRLRRGAGVDAIEYEGEFRQGQRHGKGALRDAMGGELAGTFRADALHGEGSLTAHGREAALITFVDGRETHRATGAEREIARLRTHIQDMRSHSRSSCCRVCGEGERTVLVLPCRHLVSCVGCRPALDASGMCPICGDATCASESFVLDE
jgi:hypothetical protein